jgi:8-oxo-dGTP pyrophosphatase MutT (NUDIX family)
MVRAVSVAEPLPSSTVILLRDEPGPEPFAVLMVERHGSVTFPGVHAFPGGVVDPGDHAPHGAVLPAGQVWASDGQGDGPHDALPYWIAAVRECFEEVGILLAHRDGAPVPGPLTPEQQALRTRLDAGEPFARLLAEHGLVPATDQLWYFARWITPKRNPRRFDTRFLVGRAPAGADAVVDATECASCRWLGPRAALALYEQGDIQLIPPTVRTLDDLARFADVDAVLEDARRRVVRAVQPEIVQVGGEPALAYPDNTGHPDVPPRTLVLRDGRWRTGR